MSNESTLSIGCVLMAAGNAERFGDNKLAALVDGTPIIRHALDAIPAQLLTAVCVVTQYPEVEQLGKEYGFTVIRNDRPRDGLSRTVRLGTEALRDRCDAIVYMVSDQPLLRRKSVAELIAYYGNHPKHIVGAAHNGKRGNPCIFPRKYYRELCELTGDVGGSAVIRAHEDDLLLWEVPQRELTDVDTPEALEALKK